MPPKKQPVTFDAWLGKVIDDETVTRGGRAAVAAWIGVSEQSVNRRARGEVPYFAREVEIISHRVGVSTAEMVARALRGYGGMDKLIAEYGVSDPIRKLDDYRKLDPATASEEELLGGKYAAGKDAELEQDEQFD